MRVRYQQGTGNIAATHSCPKWQWVLNTSTAYQCFPYSLKPPEPVGVVLRGTRFVQDVDELLLRIWIGRALASVFFSLPFRWRLKPFSSSFGPIVWPTVFTQRRW
jgi:hypothetical protein